VCVPAFVHKCKYVRVHVFMYIHINHFECVSVCVYLRMRVFACLYVRVRVRSDACVHVYEFHTLLS